MNLGRPVFDQVQWGRRGVHRVHAGSIGRVEILRRIALKLLQTALAAEVVGLPLMLGAASRPGWVHLHAAHDVSFHPSGLHYQQESGTGTQDSGLNTDSCLLNADPCWFLSLGRKGGETITVVNH
jgi:hypothetical protein